MALGKSNDFKMCQSCRALIPAGATQCEMCGAAGHYASRAGSVNDPLAIFGAWPVTTLLITANLAIYAIVLLYQAQLPSEAPNASGFSFEPRHDIDVLGPFGAVSAAVRYTGEWWRLIAYCFLHGGILHIAMNTFGLLQAGRIAEELWGRAQYIILYLLSGIGGGLVVMMGKTSAVGASGALFGLIAAMLVHGYRRGDLFGKALQQYSLSWLLYGIAISFSPRVSMAGHVGGALVGGALAWFMPGEERLRQNMGRTRIMQTLATVGVIAVLLTGGWVTRNLQTYRAVSGIQDFSNRILVVMDNVRQRERKQFLASMKDQAGQLPAERERFNEAFEQAFDGKPEDFTTEKLNQDIATAQSAVCSDVGTLERWVAPDAASATLLHNFVTALRDECANPVRNLAELGQGQLMIPTQGSAALNTAYRDYWQWLEARSAQLGVPIGKLLPFGNEPFAREVLRRATGTPPAKPAATP